MRVTEPGAFGDWSAARQAPSDTAVNDAGASAEVERWNRILTSDEGRFNRKPNAFLARMVQGRTPADALDVGMGQGRNSVFLATKGWRVTGFDPADRAVALARQHARTAGVALTALVQGDDEFRWEPDRWDLIVLSYVNVRHNASRVISSLKPGGIVVVEAFHSDATQTAKIGGAVVFDDNELLELFRSLRVLRYEDTEDQADFSLRTLRLVRLCAQKAK
jgi:2-polyprenyl-3-methyl-5-hydroxy-6-metoxy-1,4-benzoquinol methylase